MTIAMTAGKKIAGLVIALTGLCAAAAFAQFISGRPRSRPAEENQAVRYLYPEQLTLPAGKASPVSLHFRVAQGLHINSHAPSESFLIPTVFSIPAGSGVRLESARYPQGANIALPADPNTRLNVYTGDFVIQARLVASPGDHLVKGELRYQACDQTQCMPPKTTVVVMDVIGR